MQITKELIAMFMAIGFGTFTLLASILNWEFFFKHRKAQLFVNFLGRSGARLFYGALGLVLFFLAYQMYID